MASEGPLICGTGGSGGDYDHMGNAGWSTPSNITADDGLYSNVILDPKGVGGAKSKWLRATNFGFDIPAGATIDGVKVTAELKASSTDQTPALSSAQLVSGGSRAGQENTSNTNLTTSDADYDRGGETDTWGMALSAATVNDSGFGVDIMVELLAPSGGDLGPTTISCDKIAMTIYFTETETGRQYQVTAFAKSVHAHFRQKRGIKSKI